MSNVSGHFSSHIGTVSQAVPAAMLQVYRRHMRTRLNSRTKIPVIFGCECKGGSPQSVFAVLYYFEQISPSVEKL